jgi:hypothetical protein
MVSHERNDNSNISVTKVELSTGNKSIEVSKFESALSMLPPGSEVEVIAVGTVGNETVHNLAKIIREGSVFVNLNLSSVDELSKVLNCPFQNNLNLIGIIFPRNLVSISAKAFLNCKNLEKVSIPASVNMIGKQAFSGCEKMNFLEFADCQNWTYTKESGENVKITNLENSEDNPYRFTLTSSPYRNYLLRKDGQ